MAKRSTRKAEKPKARRQRSGPSVRGTGSPDGSRTDPSREGEPGSEVVSGEPGLEGEPGSEVGSGVPTEPGSWPVGSGEPGLEGESGLEGEPGSEVGSGVPTEPVSSPVGSGERSQRSAFAGDMENPENLGEPVEDLPDVSWGPGKNFHGWLMSLVLIGLVGGVGYAGFKIFGETVRTADSSGTVEERRKLEREVRTLGADLCTASIQAGTAPDSAATLFQGKVHGPLHGLADALAAEDRPAAAKLLRDKFAVEEDIRRNAPPPKIGASFAALNESTMDGLRILSLPSPACPPAGAPPGAPGAPPPASGAAPAGPGEAPGAAGGAVPPPVPAPAP